MIQDLRFKKRILLFVLSLTTLFTIHYLLFPAETLAHCPLCAAGAGAGLTLSRVLGIHDSITGVWIAAFLGAMALWTDNALSKRRKIPFSRPLIYLAIFGLTIWSFYRFNLIDTHGDVFGIHKLTFGMIIGGPFLYLVDIGNELLIKKNKKVLFPYQRLIVSLAGMLLLSFAVFLLIYYYV